MGTLPAPMVSVLIVSWNTRDLLDACLSSIERFPGSHGVEVIVVDNASSDGSAEMVRGKHPAVHLIEAGGNTGYAHGNNLASTASRGEFLLTLNPDTEVFEDTLDQAVDVMNRHPEAGALGARQFFTDGSTQSSVRGFPSFWGILGDITGLGRIFPGSKLGSYRLMRFDYEVEQAAPQPMGTFLMFRREALPSDRPFDESFPIFFNEVDLLFRLKEAGWMAVYSPRVRILHHGGEGTKQRRKEMIWESHRSLVRYFEKHHPSSFLFLLKAVVYLGAFVRAKGVYAGFRP